MTQQIIRTYRDGVLIHEETVELPDAPPTPGEQISALAVAARLSVTETVRSGDLPVEMLAQLAPIYPLWEPGLSVAAGDVLSRDSTLVECVQAHTTQADWAPGLTPALWRVYRDVARLAPRPAGTSTAVARCMGRIREHGGGSLDGSLGHQRPPDGDAVARHPARPAPAARPCRGVDRV